MNARSVCRWLLLLAFAVQAACAAATETAPAEAATPEPDAGHLDAGRIVDAAMYDGMDSDDPSTDLIPRPCGEDGACPEHTYCSYGPSEACGASGPGVCVYPQLDCGPDEYRPVCGCDGVSHGNRCRADAVQVGIAHEGVCPDAGGIACGGSDLSCPRIPCDCAADASPDDCRCPMFDCVDGECVMLELHASDGVGEGHRCSLAAGAEPCEEGLYCKTRFDCSAMTGLCEPIMLDCAISSVSTRICGCDGNTYVTECRINREQLGVRDYRSCEDVAAR